ncbi:MAG TPA: AraC family transcriptional regulator [Chitinophaga sp.]|uniref:helix-turn-helix transcriptional regulator n=1 Tax=Chitinophaga sp. TaxID=1869181 RepID=UPI002CE86140|nr:AraC family transcriptional regulator [Chitinophaga sp.]HVI46864.1 AraC family transcriptional regulator [Chitinophaga sp.]
MKGKLLREITPLTQRDCFTLFSGNKSELDAPLHYHEEFEINFIRHGKGAHRVIGDHTGIIDDLELVLVGPNLQHGWSSHKQKNKIIKVVSIQFHRDLLDEKFLHRHQLSHIKNMFERSLHGILFPLETTRRVMPQIIRLNRLQGFSSVLELMSILHHLSVSRHMRTLSGSTYHNLETISYNSRRVEKIMTYLNENFHKETSLSEAARMVSMTDAAFSRFFKSRMGKTFMDTLLSIRLGHASRLLITTPLTIQEIALQCGFNNISNFNRIFKKKKDCTPKEFRLTYMAAGTRTFV